jgi:hypothetical protein
MYQCFKCGCQIPPGQGVWSRQKVGTSKTWVGWESFLGVGDTDYYAQVIICRPCQKKENLDAALTFGCIGGPIAGFVLTFLLFYSFESLVGFKWWWAALSVICFFAIWLTLRKVA